MAILKLKNAGDEATLDIVRAEVVTGEYGQQVKFDAANGDTLYVPESSVLRQLDRCKVAEIEELSGTTLHFYRAPNSKKGGAPFWNIDAARPEDVKTPPTNGKPVVAQQPDPPKANPNAKTVPGGLDDAAYADALVGGEDSAFIALTVKYRECAAAATDVWGSDMSSEAIVAAAATLFIARNQKNI